MTHEHDPLTEALRDNLHRHAADAPSGDFLAERIISAAEQGPVADRRPNRGWRTWTLPLIAAGAVAGVVGAVVGLVDFQNEASHTSPGNSGQPSLFGTELPTQQPTQQISDPPTALPPPPSRAPSGLEDVRIIDLTFVGDDNGWALGSATCLKGQGRCTALWRTTDGYNWKSMPGAAFNVPEADLLMGAGSCAEPCVHNIRFANDQVGYAFGPSAFFVTTDGGASWDQQKGGAIALETLDNNVIRVTMTHSGCPGPCDVRVETSGIGSADWLPAKISDIGPGIAGVHLARGGHNAYLLVTRFPAGGAEDENSTLYRSTDDGQNWQSAGEPCVIPDAGEIDSVAIAGGADDRVTALCTSRQSPHRSNVAWSDDAGAHFGVKPGEIPADVSPYLLTGDPDTVLVAAGLAMARSTDGGHTWQQVDGVSGGVGWVGFESETVGRAVSGDGSTIWTTRDAGATWRATTFG